MNVAPDGAGTASPALVELYDTVLFDLDGVLYRGPDTVAGGPEAVASLRARGVRLAFVTNNSSRTPEQVAAKLAGHGVDAATGEVVTSAMVTADLLGERGGSTAYVIGETGIREALRQAGLEVLPDEADRADYVVVGVDSAATYDRLRTAALLVQRGATLVATNADASYPAPDGLWPGAGALLSVITTTTGRPPDAVVGKPHPPLLRGALERAGGSRPLVVGDRLDTDISGAAAVGWDSLLVLTGVSTVRDLVGAADLPTFLADDLGALFRPSARIRPARPGDAEAIEVLLAHAGLQTEAVDVRVPDTLVAEVPPGEVVGTVSLELFGRGGGLSDGAGPRMAHLRSLAVATDHRNGRLGSLLAARAVRLALDRGASVVHAVTDTASGFFERIGFEPTGPRDSLPEVIRATPMVATACSSSSTAFRWEARLASPAGRPDATDTH
ncbi:MAG: HAD-IIA family hydrolase [Actinomycetota bacterium]